MKHTISAITLCLVILFGLIGCAHKNSTNTSDLETAPTSTGNSGISTNANDEFTTSNSTAATTTTVQEKTNTTVSHATTVVKPTVTKKPTTTTTSRQQTPTTSPQPVNKWDYPAQGNEELLKQRIVYYINEYRVKDGKSKVVDNQTPAMQRFADLRAIDITMDFSHNEDTTMATANKAKYGKLIDEGFYDASTGKITYTGKKIYTTVGVGNEAIGQALNGSVDQAAKSAADGVYSSKGHWAYIGSNDYQYMVAGVKYANGVWYIALECCSQNDLQYAK